MTQTILKENENIKVIKYTWFKNNPVYIMYVYKIDDYLSYKENIQKKGYYITKIYKIKEKIKIVYKKGIKANTRIMYFDNFSLVWINRAIDLWLIKK